VPHPHAPRPSGLVLLVKGRYEARKLAAETKQIEVDTASDVKDEAQKEAMRVIEWLRIQREEHQRMMEEQKTYYEKRLEEKDSKHEAALTSLRKSLEAEIRKVARRIDIYGCKKATDCGVRVALDARNGDTGDYSVVPG
jgi:hypothetical protein